MRIYTKAGDLAFKTFTFPDGQPHFKLETYEREFDSVTVEMALRSGSDLLTLILASDTLRNHGYSQVNLDIRYLLGARMDRAIDSTQPFTLQSIARIINSCGFSKVRILDVHSEVATRLIRNSVNIRPYAAFEQVLATLGDVIAVRPDAGAEERTSCYMNGEGFIRCSKKRDMQTGALTGFKVDEERVPYGCSVLIVDDICDGGGTFTGLAKVLREAGAKKVYLYVTHAILSKGPYLEGIDKIFTTDSYRGKDDRIETPGGGGKLSDFGVTVIPISMKEMK